MPRPEERPRARRRSVTPDLFKAAGSPARRPPFAETDRRDHPGVAIVDEVFARQNFPDGNAIGSRISFRSSPPVQNPSGSRGRTRRRSWASCAASLRDDGADPEPTIYLPFEQARPASVDCRGLDGAVRSDADYRQRP